MKWKESLPSFSVFFIPFFLGIGAMASTRGVDHSWQPWRCPINGGINALYCYLRINGVACEYGDLVKAQAEEVGTGSYSANTLVHLAAKKSLPLRAASVTMKELELCAKPVITYMTSDTPDDGAFVLVLSTTQSDIFYVNGSTATIEMMPREAFRRVWSAIALLPVTRGKQNLSYYATGLCAGLVLVLVLGFFRAKGSSEESCY